MRRIVITFVAVAVIAAGCDPAGEREMTLDYEFASLDDVARMLSALPVGTDQMQEVHDAVVCSSDNGYDEEYMMRDLLTTPGAGVRASDSQTKSTDKYPRPMRDLIRDYMVQSVSATKSGDAAESEVERRLGTLAASDIQIYWPYADSWDGETLPVVTFNPGGESSVNIGYEIIGQPDGSRSVRTVTVNEQMAMERPVWVVNTNDDSAYESLEILRRDYPGWGGDDDIIVSTKSMADAGDEGHVPEAGANALDGEFHSLILRDFTMLRHFDPWFCGASEFFVKCGAVEGFTASTEAEMLLYTPSVTDFMIVVKRKQLGQRVPFNAVLISEWSSQLESFGFMIIESDGGTRTSWKLDAVVKVKSKSYGITVELPLNTRDDIVWRGSLSSRYFERYSGSVERFGDVELTFEIR